MPNLRTITDGFGRGISLALSPPKLVKLSCKEAVLRGLERGASAAVLPDFAGAWSAPVFQEGIGTNG
eukprot:2425721-Pyramimonas_sp.AAC.1